MAASVVAWQAEGPDAHQPIRTPPWSSMLPRYFPQACFWQKMQESGSNSPVENETVRVSSLVILIGIVKTPLRTEPHMSCGPAPRAVM